MNATEDDDGNELETRDKRYKKLVERHLGKNGTSILVFHTFLLVLAVLMVMFLNISFTKTQIEDNGGLASSIVANELSVKPAILSI